MDPFYWSIILIAGGFLIIFAELFIPSAGILGIAAAACLISGIVVAFFDSVQMGMLSLLTVLILLPVMFSMMIKIWPHTPIGKRILIGPVAHEDVIPTGEYYSEIHSLVGRLGVVKTPMLPSGIVVIDGKKYDAVSDGLPLDPGETIKVTVIKGNRVFVSKYDGEATDADLPATDSGILSQSIEDLGLDPLDDPLG